MKKTASRCLLVVLLAGVAVPPLFARDLPQLPAGFKAELIAQEPLIRNPVSICFDAKGRILVGWGPQFRNPQENTPGDRISILIDKNKDGRIDGTKTFAEGFNCIQSMAWYGNDLYVANAPELTLVRDTDGDDEADEYWIVYTNLGNIEHALHGLVFGPDGKLYMTKGNSKARAGLPPAPKPFYDLWHIRPPKGSENYGKLQGPYRSAEEYFRKGKKYHNPGDDWGLRGGVLRCDPQGKNLEIVSRGNRNPWDMAMDAGFNWIGSDNDQDGGDKTFMPFMGAHFGWGHRWSSVWKWNDHAPTVPESAPFQIGAATGVTFYGFKQFPKEYQNVWFLNDWDRKRIWCFRPTWEGALLKEARGTMEAFATAGGALFGPSDITVGPDGALYCNGWGSGYGAEPRSYRMKNEGRLFKIWHQEGGLIPREKWYTPKRDKPHEKWTVAELIEDLGVATLPVWRVNAQNELVRRGQSVVGELQKALASGKLDAGRETWVAWTIGRIAPEDTSIDDYLAKKISANSGASLNLRIQSLRILAYRIRNHAKDRKLPAVVMAVLSDPQPRIRFEAVQAIWQADDESKIDALAGLASVETDYVTFYSLWNALRELPSLEARRAFSKDVRPQLRYAMLMGFLHDFQMDRSTIQKEAYAALDAPNNDPRTVEWAVRWMTARNEDYLPYRPDRYSPKARSKEVKFRHLDEILRRFRDQENPRLQAAFMSLIASTNFGGGDWDQVKQIYQEYKGKKTNQHITPAHVAELLRSLARDQRALTLLWEALAEKETVYRDAAVDGLEALADAGRDFLTEKLAAANGVRLSAAIGCLARFKFDQRPFAPSAAGVKSLAAAYDTAAKDPSLRGKVVGLLASIDKAKLRGDVRTIAVRLAQDAATSTDPRVHAMVPLLASKLGISITINKRPPIKADDVLPLLANANPARGKEIFFSRRANCTACHMLDGRGTNYAPPLSDVGLRNTLVKQILESVLEPSKKITEGYHMMTIVTTDGKVYNGAIRREAGGRLELFTQDARTITIPTAEIEIRKRQEISLMPSNFNEILAAEEVADLVAWLATRKTPPLGQQTAAGQ